MTHQDAFTKMKNFLLAQNAKSEVKNEIENRCLYRGPNNTACAVGCLIPDDEYSPEFEAMSLVRVQESVSTLRDLRFEFLFGAQRVHDAYPVSLWPEKLKALAESWNLKYEED